MELNQQLKTRKGASHGTTHGLWRVRRAQPQAQKGCFRKPIFFGLCKEQRDQTVVDRRSNRLREQQTRKRFTEKEASEVFTNRDQIAQEENLLAEDNIVSNIHYQAHRDAFICRNSNKIPCGVPNTCFASHVCCGSFAEGTDTLTS